MNFWPFLFLVFTFFQPNHAFYVSVTDIAYVSAEGAVEIQVKIFTDDLEDALRDHSNQAINLEDGIISDEEELVYEYVSRHLELLVDGQRLVISQKSCIREGDAVFSKYTGKVNAQPGKLEVTSSLLLQVFPTQTNIVRLLKEEGQGILKLNKGTITGELSF